VTDSYDDSISGYTINPTSGTLTNAVGSPYGAGSTPWCLAFAPAGKFIYAVNSALANVSAYTVNTHNGKLKPVVGSPFAAGNLPLFVAIDPRGKFAYVDDLTDNTISAYLINAKSGALTPVAGSPFAAGSPAQIATCQRDQSTNTCIPPPL
jgi:6-phosphogluconolactonase (cycloisomerase 2 family)